MRGRRRCKRAGARYAAMRHRLSALAVCTCRALSGLRLHAPGRLYVAVFVVSVVRVEVLEQRGGHRHSPSPPDIQPLYRPGLSLGRCIPDYSTDLGFEFWI